MDRITKERIAEFICGDNQKYPSYRSSQYLNSFFREIGIDATHDGSIRKSWTLSVIERLDDADLRKVILRLTSPRLYAGNRDIIALAAKRMNEILEIECLKVIFNGVEPELITEVPNYNDTRLGVRQNLHDQESRGVNPSMKIFVSHSNADQGIAEAFVNLIKSSLRIQAKDIRCTSVDGYRLPAGVDAAAQLRQEVFASDIFVALLSPTSITSIFVMFELGARWGAEKTLMPVLVRSISPRDLRPPLSAIHAVNGSEPGQLHQMLDDIAAKLELKLEPVAAYLANLEAFRKAAASP